MNQKVKDILMDDYFKSIEKKLNNNPGEKDTLPMLTKTADKVFKKNSNNIELFRELQKYLRFIRNFCQEMYWDATSIKKISFAYLYYQTVTDD